MKLVSGALASLVVLASISPAGAQTTAGTPFTVGDFVVSGAIRSRTYSWNWFGDLPEGGYWHQGTQIRLGISRSKKRYDWQLEFEVPFMLHLPTTAVKAAPQGQLGLGAAYFAANDGNANPAGLFLKQGYVRFFQVLPTARIYARTPFFNLMNSVDAFGELVLRPSNRVTLRTDLHSIRLARNNDLWYSGGGAFQSGTFGYNGRPSNGQTRLGTLYDVSGDITLNRYVGLGLYYAYVRSHDVARAIFPAGSGARFGFVEWQFRF